MMNVAFMAPGISYPGLEEVTRTWGGAQTDPVPTYALAVYNAFMREAQNGGWYRPDARVWIFCPPSFTGNALNLFKPAELGSFVGPVTLVPYRSMQGDGSTSYFDALIAASVALTGLAGTIWGYMNSQEIDGTGRGDFGAGTAGAQVGADSWDGSTSRFNYSSPILTISRGSTTGIGLFGAGRDGGNLILIQNAGREAVPAASTGLLPVANINFGRERNNFSHKEISFGGTDKVALSKAEILSIRLACVNVLLSFNTYNPSPAPTPLGPNYWTRGSIATVLPAGVAVFRQNEAPISDTQTNLVVGTVPGYSRFPLTDTDAYLSASICASVQTLIRYHYRVWVCRFNTTPANKPNPVDGVDLLVNNVTCRQIFDRDRDANWGQSIASVMKALGFSDADIMAEMVANWGYPAVPAINTPVAAGGWLFTAIYAEANRADIFTGSQGGYSVSNNIVIIPPFAMADVVAGTCNSIRLDMEMADNSPPPQFEKGMNRLLDLVEAAGKTVSLGTNAFQNQAVSTGITPEYFTSILPRPGVLWAQVVVVDTPSMAGQTADLEGQIDYFRFAGTIPNYPKIQVATSMGSPAMSTANALAGFGIATKYGMGYRITAGRSPWGGDKTEPWNVALSYYLTGAAPP